MLAERIIEPVSSPYSSQPSIQTKKDSTSRFCIDYRRLNDITIDAAQPLPIIHQTLKDLGQAKFFEKRVLAFAAASRLQEIYCFCHSRRRTISIPSDAIWIEERALYLPEYNEGSSGYFLEKIIVYSHTTEEHLNHLALIFERLELYGLTCNPKKCHCGKTKLEYLGHIVTSDGNQAQPGHIQAIKKLKSTMDT